MTDIHAGHRERLRTRYDENGADAFADHELLELLLTYAIPRRDTNRTAHLLLQEFGSLGGVFSAAREDLMRIDGIGPTTAQMLQLVGDMHMRRELERIERRNGRYLLDSPLRTICYATSLFAAKRTEVMFVLCLNAQRVLIKKECVAIGSVTELIVYPQTILRIAITAGAHSVILLHNHPSGDPTPSKVDVETTHAIYQTLKPANVQLADHIIIGSNYHYSFATRKILHPIGNSMEALTEEEYNIRSREITPARAVVLKEYCEE